MQVILSRLLDSVTGTGAGLSAGPAQNGMKTFHATLAGTGAITATVLVEVSNDNSNWVTLGTISLTGTTATSDGFASEAPWLYYRGNVSAITGTGATLNLLCGGL